MPCSRNICIYIYINITPNMHKTLGWVCCEGTLNKEECAWLTQMEPTHLFGKKKVNSEKGNSSIIRINEVY